MQKPSLNPQQQKAATHTNGPLLIIAGAGTGKTTVIIERIKHFILTEKLSPKNILALTFTEKAAHEMQERIDIALPYGYTDMWIHTFHGFCDRILRNEAHHIGIDSGYKLLSDAESNYFLQSHIFDLGLKRFKPLGKPTKFLDTLSNHFSRLADEDITPDAYIAWAHKQTENEDKEMYHELATAYKKYQDIKIKESVMDFSDLISHTLQLLRSRKNVLKKYNEIFSCILVDEFQDTNYAQNELAILLAGDRKNITVVADDDQSIYRFRGAAVSNVMQFKKRFPNAYIIALTENYRSTQKILDSAYQLIQFNNPNRLEITENINKKLHSNSQKPNKDIILLHAKNAEQEAKEIVDKIATLIRQGYDYRDIAILVRANNHAQQVQSLLQQHHLPYKFLGPEYLFQQEEIKDLIAYLFFLTNITDSVSLYRVLSMDIFHIPAIELNQLLIHAKNQNLTLFHAIKNFEHDFLSDKTKEEIKKFLAIAEKHMEMGKRNTAWTVLYNFLVDSQLLALLHTVNTIDEEKRTNNIVKFFEKIKKFETNSINPDIYAVAEWIHLMQLLGSSPKAAEEDFTEDDAINILTVHAAKGLEFKAVFLINLVSDRFPTRDRSEKIPLPEGLLKESIPLGTDFHMEEERRLFYVGITRAKEQLFFTASDYYGEGKRIKKLSPFIAEAVPNIQEVSSKKENSISTSVQEKLSPIQNEKSLQKKSPYRVTYITYSNLQLFDICPLHYKARVILKIPTPPTANQTIGIAVHKALQLFYEKIINNEKPTKNELLTLLTSEWKEVGFANSQESEEGLQEAKTLLNNYYETECHPAVKPLSVEVPFTFTLKNGVKASGVIDRIDKTINGIEIIDYKTGEESEKARKSYEEQLALYALAATRIKDPLFNQKPENITLTLYFLKGNTKKTIHFSKEDLEKFEDKLIATIQTIEASDFACSKKPLCQNCEYALLCNVSNN